MSQPGQERGSGRPTAVVVGSGIAGMTAAYILQRTHDVTLLEADDRVGGHADTHDVLTPDGRWIRIDTGFIVHNRLTYPNLLRLFAELDVPTKETEMSMSISCPQCGLEYAGGRGMKGVFAQRRRVADPRYVRMLVEVKRFHRDALRFLEQDPADVDSISLAGFVAVKGYSEYFVNHFLVPVVSCVWSTGAKLSLEYPARYLFEFLRHHQMLQVTGSPIWRTVDGGSRTYVERVVKSLTAVETSTPVQTVRRPANGVDLTSTDGRTFHADKVVIATHPAQALGMLADPTDDEREVLGAIHYSVNTALLHTDPRLLPSAPEARSSWNYAVPTCQGRPDKATGVSYWMNRLHQIDEPVDYVVSLNSTDRVDPAAVIATREYDHPIYTAESLAAQRRLPSLRTARTAYAGAYHGWGFHEDGCRSGVEAAAALGASWD